MSRALFYTADLPPWLKWGFWLSPMTYGEIGISLNEFLAPRWQKVQSDTQMTDTIHTLLGNIDYHL